MSSKAEKRKRMKQRTLGSYFTKYVTHRNERVEVSIPEFVETTKKDIKCKHCGDFFKSQQGLSVHLLCKHPDDGNKSYDSAGSVAAFLNRQESGIENVVEKTLDDIISIIESGGEVHRFESEETTSSSTDEIDITKVTKKTARRGQDKRTRYKASYKAEVINEAENGMKEDLVATKFGISRINVIKWMKEKEKIMEAAASEHKNKLKIQPSIKYKDMYRELLKTFKEARQKGFRVDFNWLWSKARVIYRNQCGDESIRKHVITTFIKRFNIRMRARQRSNKVAKESFREDLRKWHANFRERLIRTGKDDSYDTKWGRYMPKERINVDQSPCPFALNVNKTYHTYEDGVDQNKEKVWISQPGSGLDKRQCTLQVCLRPVGKQPPLAIIFRGEGKRISEDERRAWHPDVHVYFQTNAWADTKFSVEWLEKTLKPFVTDLDRFLLLCDNLSAQTAEEFKAKVASLSGVVWYGLKGATDLWQQVDAGYAQLLKVLIYQAHRNWLDSDENADRWYGNTDPFTAKERRILLTHWSGEAYKKLIQPEYNNFRLRLWQKTGGLLTADGSEDSLVAPEGLANYVVPPPSIYVEPTTAMSSSNEPEATDGNESTVAAEGLETEEEDIESGYSAEDSTDAEDDRMYDYGLVGMRIKALYENGWFTGDIKHYNPVLDEYMVRYDDQSVDYIRPDEIDGVEVILLS